MFGICSRRGTTDQSSLMKLLFDQNISFRIIPKLKDVFPEAKQVRELALENGKVRKCTSRRNLTLRIS